MTMIENIPTQLWFAAGLVIQAFLMLQHKFDAKGFAETLIISAFVAFINIFFVQVTNIDVVIAIFSVTFAIAFVFKFQKDILPEIGEQNILSYAIILWFIFLAYFSKFQGSSLIIGIILGLFTIWILQISFFDFKLSTKQKLLLYVFVLMANIILIFSQFTYGNLIGMLMTSTLVLNPFELILAGMVSVYLLLNVMAVIQLIPFMNENESISQTIERCKEHAKMLAEKLTDYQLRPLHAALIIIFEVGTLATNYYLKIVPDFVVINLWILAAFYTKDFEKIWDFVQNLKRV